MVLILIACAMIHLSDFPKNSYFCSSFHTVCSGIDEFYGKI
ncbi:hypothetical protein MuYL_3910 [Mucilaginibacter xinganensis]|uniref:Uncharacterized protein n=1 Tax=Mucilaginibacter xinganensis TaxID=1234841 RepID=A0A223P103_9SPHI|nr:hypothetical protein MuYL_3910 [Mucilaginibacter xinganensis]